MKHAPYFFLFYYFSRSFSQFISSNVCVRVGGCLCFHPICACVFYEIMEELECACVYMCVWSWLPNPQSIWNHHSALKSMIFCQRWRGNVHAVWVWERDAVWLPEIQLSLSFKGPGAAEKVFVCLIIYIFTQLYWLCLQMGEKKMEEWMLGSCLEENVCCISLNLFSYIMAALCC